MSSKPVQYLTSTRLLAKNTFWNVVGQGLPMVVGILVIPALIHKLGTARFGILTLAWAVIGYSSLFDLGLSRALTKLVAEKLGTTEEKELPSLAWTGLGLMFASGLIGAALMSAISPWLANSALRIPADLRHETLLAFYEISASIPIVIVTAGLRGILEAQQLFGVVNAVRTPLGILTFLGPWFSLFSSHKLTWVVFSLIAARLLALLAYLTSIFFFMPALIVRRSWQPSAVKPLLSFGGWMTVTNILGPVMLYLDRFLIGSLVSISAVAYYATPYDMVTKLLLVPTALTAVLFPAFALISSNDDDHAIKLFRRGMIGVFLALFPPILMLVAFAPQVLKLWLGNDFAQNSSSILQWLAMGVFINSVAQIAFAMVQGMGRPDLTAKLHACELPVYLPVVYLFIRSYGIEGAAFAWLLRMVVDAGVLFFLAKWVSPRTSDVVLRTAVISVGAICLFFVVQFITTFAVRCALVVLVLLLFLSAAWFWMLVSEERALLLKGRKLDPASV